jgi:hypothetical protein
MNRSPRAIAIAADGQHKPWNPRTVGIALAAYQPDPVWLAEQLASIAAQTHMEWICMITLDSPLQEIRSSPVLTPFIHDARFMWVENPERLGLRSNFQKTTQLLLEQDVDLIAFCDQDDVWLPEKLAESVAAIRTHGPLSMVYCDAFLLVNNVKETDRLHEYSIRTRGKMSIAERIIQPQVSGFCEVFDATLAKLHPVIPVESPDHDHWYSLVAAAYGGVHRIDKPLALYRQHAGNTIGITAVRAAQGWGTTTQLNRYASLRDNAQLRAGIARGVGKELPMSRGLAALYQHSAGWLLILLGVMARRLFSDQPLAANAYRKAWGLLLMETSRRELVQEVRKRFPAKLKIVRTALVVAALLLAALTLLLLHGGVLAYVDLVTVIPALLLVASGAITGLRYVQHQMPNSVMLVIGIGSVASLLLQMFNVEPLLALAVAVAPIVANGLYRLHWALRP